MCVYLHMKVKVKLLSCVRLFATPWTVAYQAPPSVEFSRQEYWSGLPFPSPGDLPDPGIEPGSPSLQADTLTSEPPEKPIYTYTYIHTYTHTHTYIHTHTNICMYIHTCNQIMSWQLLFSSAVNIFWVCYLGLLASYIHF